MRQLIAVCPSGRPIPFVHHIRPEHAERRLVWHVFAAVALVILLMSVGTHVHALDAAGAFNGRGSGIAGIKKFVDAIKADLIWVVGVCSGLAVVIVGAMFMAGHTRAQDYALRAGIGFLILAGGTGIVS
jgi:hypothetical protein